MNARTDDAGARRGYRLGELAEMVDGRIHGDAGQMITGIADLSTAVEGDLSFIVDAKYLDQLRSSSASGVVAPPNIALDRPGIIVTEPQIAFAKLIAHFAPPSVHPRAGIHPSAVVESDLPKSVAVGANAYVGPGTTVGEKTVVYANVHVGPHVTIGEECLIYPGVAIRERITIGDRVIIHPNATIGSDGFGYNLVDGCHRKVPHIGTVVIEDDVELGAGVCVDRAKVGATVIGRGTKVDNLVQIGHNVRIGPNTILVSHVGIGGSTTLGQYVVLGGKVGVRDHVTIGDRVQAAACCCISKDVPPGSVVNGIPAIDNREYLRQQGHVRRLGHTVEKLTQLTKRIDELEQTIHDLESR